MEDGWNCGDDEMSGGVGEWDGGGRSDGGDALGPELVLVLVLGLVLVLEREEGQGLMRKGDRLKQ